MTDVRGLGARLDGQTAVPCCAFSSGFTDPSPPPGQVHTYQFKHQGARVERRSAGNHHDAAQVSGVTIAQDRE
jgi:hypothetical protein